MYDEYISLISIYIRLVWVWSLLDVSNRQRLTQNYDSVGHYQLSSFNPKIFLKMFDPPFKGVT